MSVSPNDWQILSKFREVWNVAKKIEFPTIIIIGFYLYSFSSL
jgi:hypothetical protein